MSATSPTAHLTPSARPHGSSVVRTMILFYGVVCYALGMGGLMWLILGTLGLVPTGLVEFSSLSPVQMVLLNLGLVSLFGIQHAIMARPAFKERWTRVIPAAAERSTFVLLSGLLMALIMFAWQHAPGSVWAVESNALRYGLIGAAGLGWTYMLLGSFMINHFELFGLAQVWRSFRGLPQAPKPFVLRGFYRVDRHPIMTGVFIGLWCTPDMTMSRLILAAAFTAYMVVGVWVEERTLIHYHGTDYSAYRQRVPALFPLPGRRS